MKEYINFRNERPSKTGKTKVWDVVSIRDDILGEIRWFGRWRRYAFHPGPLTVYEPGCMRVIANYCEIATARHKKDKTQCIAGVQGYHDIFERRCLRNAVKPGQFCLQHRTA